MEIERTEQVGNERQKENFGIPPKWIEVRGYGPAAVG